MYDLVDGKVTVTVTGKEIYEEAERRINDEQKRIRDSYEITAVFVGGKEGDECSIDILMNEKGWCKYQIFIDSYEERDVSLSVNYEEGIGTLALAEAYLCVNDYLKGNIKDNRLVIDWGRTQFIIERGVFGIKMYIEHKERYDGDEKFVYTALNSSYIEYFESFLKEALIEIYKFDKEKYFNKS